MDFTKPKKKTARSLQAEASRMRIYVAARKLIAEKGFEATGINEICAEARCSVGAFYHHFGSKDGIIRETFKNADERFIDFVRNDLSAVRGAASRIEAYFVRYAELIETDTGLDLSKRLYSTANKIFAQKGRAMQRELSRILSEGLASGELKLELGAEEACEWLFLGARGVAFDWCLRDGGYDIAEAMRTYARRALRGIGT